MVLTREQRLKKTKPHQNPIAQDKKRHKCEHCEKRFQHKRDLVRHIRTHRGEKPLVCSICHKSFGRKSTLVQHARTHSGEKPYFCKHCQKLIQDPSDLKIHKKSHSELKPFECGFCDFSAAGRALTIIHERIHTGERPFRCQYCSFATAQMGNLKTHQKVCTEVYRSRGFDSRTRSYKCLHCPKVYHYLASLHKHTKSHKVENLQTQVPQPLWSKSPNCLFSGCRFAAATDAEVALHMVSEHKLPVVRLKRLKIVDST